ncbi:MAG: leucine-rich repeat domain-containing protein [Phycisphaerales bacterium]|nr:MAG: leucine-rich repeat domain-containing protein [Phycisphaerales bacterium]
MPLRRFSLTAGGVCLQNEPPNLCELSDRQPVGWAGFLPMPFLTELYVEGNQLTNVPAELEQLTKLRYLDLRGNHLMAGAAAPTE